MRCSACRRKGLHHDLCSPAALFQMQKFLQRQRIRPAVPDDPRQAHRTGPGWRRRCCKEESILTVDYWPDPWTIEKTDPALRVQKVFPLSDEGREAAAAFLQDAFNAEPERWKSCPSMMDCDPWEPAAEDESDEPKE